MQSTVTRRPPRPGVTASTPTDTDSRCLGDNNSDSQPRRSLPTVEGMTINAITLNNGVDMPALGLGVFQTPPDVTTTVVEEALRLGYRHIDTAAAYANEREVGEGIRRAGIARDDIFIETKV